LSPRQHEIFDLVVIGQSNKESARTLGLSESTIKIHITKLFEKLGVRNRGAVALAGAKVGLSLVSVDRFRAHSVERTDEALESDFELVC
jgi:two-component system nitrate/nitrite response regulator NarL